MKLLTLIFMTTLAAAFAVDAPPNPDTGDSLEQVLQIENFDLATRLGDVSEYGQNEAARLQANARRIKTESRIAAKSIRRVMVLARWRKALNQWHDLELEIVWIQGGGGTMWLHMMDRNDAQLEEFLDGVADRLPLEGTKIRPETELKIDNLLKAAKNRLAQAIKDATKTGQKPRKMAGDLDQRLPRAHAELKAIFRFAGDDETTAELLAVCEDAATMWDAMNSNPPK